MKPMETKTLGTHLKILIEFEKKAIFRLVE